MIMPTTSVPVIDSSITFYDFTGLDSNNGFGSDESSQQLSPAQSDEDLSLSSSISVSASASIAPSITSSSKSSRVRKAPDDDEEDDVPGVDKKAKKRIRNTLAVRKYRQKHLDRVTELEQTLDEVKKQRDDLQLKLARQEAETKLLREMLGMKK
jgi:hypothetical protein